jgi:hypothetical protein
MNDDKLKYLEFIQNQIQRFAENSMSLKKWAVTLITALLVLSYNENNYQMLLIAFIPLFLFWIIDSFYLHKERGYRKLYDKIRKIENNVDFNMNTNLLEKGKNTWLRTSFSKMLIIFYGSLSLCIMLIYFIIKK